MPIDFVEFQGLGPADAPGVRMPTAATITRLRPRLAAGGPPQPITPPGRLAAALATLDLGELEIAFEDDEQILWANQRHTRKLHFTCDLLRDIRKLQLAVKSHCAAYQAGDDFPFRYLVWSSQSDGVFNLGGDLELFSELIARRSKADLAAYAKLCVDVCHENAANMGLPIITIALVQGDALGGGFESVLSSDLIVAERRARFGLPEILFGLFPGMGAYSFLARRVGVVAAERMIFSGKIYSAEELHALGVVDVLADDGLGESVMLDHIRSSRRHYAAHRAMYKVRQHFNAVTYDEMMSIAEIWVDTALQLTDGDMRKMRRLAAAQDRRRGHAAAPVPVPQRLEQHSG